MKKHHTTCETSGIIPTLIRRILEQLAVLAVNRADRTSSARRERLLELVERGMAELSNPALSALIGAIYDCTLDPSQWDQTLERIAGMLACKKAILSLNELRQDRILIKKTVGWEPFWLEERTRHLPEIHGGLGPWLLSQSCLDKPFVASREIPAPSIEASPYVQKCLRPQGIVDVAHFFLISTPTHFSELVLFWQEEHGIITAREMELGALLRRICGVL